MTPSAKAVPRVEGLSQEAFINDYVRASKPVIIAGATAGWAGPSRWTADYLRAAEPNLRVWVQFVDDRLFHFEAGVMRLIRFSHYIDLLTTKRSEHERAYLQAFPLADTQKLKDDVGVPAQIPERQLKQTQLWLGGGATIPLHFDNFDTLLTQIVGRKRVRLFPRGMRGFYPRPLLSRSWQTSHVDADRPDLGRFPAFPADQEQIAEFQAGEMLFIPMFWWHHVEHEGLTASISYGFRSEMARRLATTSTGRRVAVRTLLEPLAMAQQALAARKARRVAVSTGRPT